MICEGLAITGARLGPWQDALHATGINSAGPTQGNGQGPTVAAGPTTIPRRSYMGNGATCCWKNRSLGGGMRMTLSVSATIAR